MKEYTEKDPKRIEDLLAVLIGAELVKANELKQYKENGLRVVAYELEDIPRLINSELTLIVGLIRTDAEGGKTWYCFTPEAQEIWDNDKKAKEFQYWETVNNKVDAAKRLFLSDLKKSPNPAETIADRIRQGKWKLNPYSDPNAVRELGLNPNAHLKEPWINLKRSRQFDNRFHNHWQIKAEVENEFLQWLIDYQKNQKPDMIAGRPFAFSADGKLIEKHPLQTIVEYFNEKGAEVQLFTKRNEYAILSISAGIDETELDELARYEADPMELETLFDLKFTEAQNSGKVSTQQSFAKAEANRLRRAWKDNASRFPIAEQWLSYLQAIAEAKEQPKGDADTSATSQESKDGTGAENEPMLTETRETVASILDPFNDKFIGKDAFEDAIDRVCRYFDGEPQLKTERIKVRGRCWRKLGKALGDIHKDIRNLESIDTDYQQFAKDTFDCFKQHDISVEKNSLRKYMTNG